MVLHSGSYRCVLFMSAFAALMNVSSAAFAQSIPTDSKGGEVAQLKSELDSARADLAKAQMRMEELSRRIDALDRVKANGAKTESESGTGAAKVYESPADIERGAQQQTESAGAGGELTEAEKMLETRVEEQHQTKVESGSKYRVKLSGLMLMNAFSNRGRVDEPDLPNVALARNGAEGSFGATLRQTVFGLQVFGPDIAGARSNAMVAVDFFGGFPQRPFGTTTGIVRLRTASAQLDWRRTSVSFGQEAPTFSPLSPTSFATIAEPAFAWAGNLWVWTPQASIEHRFSLSENTSLAIGGSVMAPLTEEPPEAEPNAGGRSRRPAFATQVALRSKWFGRQAVFGAGGYSSHLVFDFGRKTNGWAFTSFWQIPLAHWLELSGEGYRGKAVGGLGGGIWQSVAYDGDPALPSTQARFLNSMGGWTQLKFLVHPKWEINSAVGQDNVLSRDLEWAPLLQAEYGAPLARNRAAFGNVIFRPKSNLLFSLEYRKIWTFRNTGILNTANQVNLGAGVSF